MTSWRSLAEAERAEAVGRQKEARRAKHQTPPKPRAKGAANPSNALPLRLRIHARDGWTCCACGRPIREVPHKAVLTKGGPPPDAATLDHRIPLAKGGHGGAGNLQAMCRRCNNRKRDSLAATPEEALLALVLCARNQSAYPGGPVLRIGRTCGGGEAWLFWPDQHARVEPAYHHQRDPRRDAAAPLSVRLEALTGWNRLGWRDLQTSAPSQPSSPTAELREPPLPDGWT